MKQQLTLRPARPEDQAAVAALSAHIWEGDDYIPRVFEEWVADPQGQFTLAFSGADLVGFGKLTEVAPGQWWLEGLRVHPEHRERGVARELHHYAIELVDKIGRGVLRFATSGQNVAVHRLAKETGFERVAAFNIAEAPAAGIAPEHGRLTLVTPRKLPALYEWFETSPHLADTAGLYEERWTWLDLRPGLADLCAQARVYGWQDAAGAYQGIAVVSAESAEKLWLNYLDAPAGTLPQVGLALRALARSKGKEMVRGKPPAAPDIRRGLQEAGFEFEPDFEMWLFERPLPIRTPEGERADTSG